MHIVCIHGWSDAAKDLQPLARCLEQQLAKPISMLALGDYTSLDDALTFDDLATAMMQAWQKQGLPTTPQSVDVVVHSMGALVLRHWLRRYFKPDQLPIRHCVMLAPANFGSALAHKGQALLGRLFKGLHYERPFQVGEQLLKGLELGSPWLWQQAAYDCFQQPLFTPARIMTTILIGAQGNTGLSALVNESGADGVVRWASADLMPVQYQVDFSQQPVHVTEQLSGNQTAFQLIADCNHHTILGTADQGLNPAVQAAVLQGLSVTKDHFAAWCLDCQQQTQQVLQSLDHGVQLQQAMLQANNQYGQPIPDYCLMGCELQQDQHCLTDHFQSQVQSDAHIYQDATQYRCLYWNIDHFWQAPQAWESLHLSLVAAPQFAPPSAEVGYLSYDDAAQPAWALNGKGLQSLMQPQRTCLLKFIVPRQQQGVFRFKTLAVK